MVFCLHGGLYVFGTLAEFNSQFVVTIARKE